MTDPRPQEYIEREAAWQRVFLVLRRRFESLTPSEVKAIVDDAIDALPAARVVSVSAIEEALVKTARDNMGDALERGLSLRKAMHDLCNRMAPPGDQEGETT